MLATSLPGEQWKGILAGSCFLCSVPASWEGIVCYVSSEALSTLLSAAKQIIIIYQKAVTKFHLWVSLSYLLKSILDYFKIYLD